GVEVGRDLMHEDLARLYGVVVYAVGAQTDRRMGIPGEDLPGSWSATEFVAWYNGHPDFQDLRFDLSVESAVVVGAGNVALDVVRMLAVSPVAILGDERVEAIEIVRNRLVADENGRVSAEPTDDHETIPCGIVFRSVGYLGVELPGVPFDPRRATIPNDCGRVTGAAGVYCAGWIKRGPSGVIGTNKKDATETIELLLEDARAGRLGRGDPS